MCVNHKLIQLSWKHTAIPVKTQMINLAVGTKVLLLQFTETVWFAYIELKGIAVMAMLPDTVFCQDFKWIWYLNSS